MLDQGPTVLSSISHVLASLSGQFSHEVTRWPPGAPGFDSPSLTTPGQMCLSPGRSSSRPKEASHWPGVGHVPIPKQMTVAKGSGALIGQT